MEYKLYRKATGNNSGQVLAIIAEHKTKLIDKFEVYTIANGSTIELKVYKDEEIKINSDGRSLWSEITWISNKWEQLETNVKLQDVVDGLRSDNFAQSFSELTKYFLNK